MVKEFAEKQRVLVVDDEELIHKLYRHILSPPQSTHQQQGVDLLFSVAGRGGGGGSGKKPREGA